MILKFGGPKKLFPLTTSWLLLDFRPENSLERGNRYSSGHYLAEDNGVEPSPIAQRAGFQDQLRTATPYLPVFGAWQGIRTLKTRLLRTVCMPIPSITRMFLGSYLNVYLLVHDSWGIVKLSYPIHYYNDRRLYALILEGLELPSIQINYNFRICEVLSHHVVSSP